MAITTESSLTLYIDIPEVGGAGRPKTALFFPNAYNRAAPLNLLVYMHGIHAKSIDQYLADSRWPLRDKIQESGKNVILVAPNLGHASSEAGRLQTDPDWYLDRVVGEIGGRGLADGGATPPVGMLILAAHSGGGKVMLDVATKLDKYKDKLRECWGFDCLYGGGEPMEYHPERNTKDHFATRPPPGTPERRWAESSIKLYLYYTDGGGTVTRSKNLKKLDDELPYSRATVERSSTQVHDDVPKQYFSLRLGESGLP